MKLLQLLKAVAVLATMVACTPRNRIIENPHIVTANQLNLDIVRVELRDSLTIINAKYSAWEGSSFRIVKDTYLKVGDEKFVMISADGIKIDKWNKVDENGNKVFTMTFPPLPPKTKSFDFIEGDNGFVLRGVDVTGRAKRLKYHPELPQALRKEIADEELPKPSRKSGMTTVNIHFMGWDKEFDEVEFEVFHLFGRSDKYTMPVDEATRSVTFRYVQYGTAVCSVQMGRLGFCRLWINPDEETDVWIDMQSAGKQLMDKREEKDLPDYNKLYSTGAYANANRVVGSTMFYNYAPFSEYTFKIDYTMSAEECTDFIVEKYKYFADSLQGITEMHPMHKRTSSIWFRLSLFECVSNIEKFRYNDFRRKNRDNNENSEFTSWGFTPEQIKKMLAPIDFSNEELLMNESSHIRMRNGIKLLDAVGVPQECAYREMANILNMMQKAYTVEYTDEELAEIKREYSSLLYETIKSLLDEEILKLEIAKGKTDIKSAPPAEKDQLFEAILEQYKGKVVVADFWEVGCGGCHLDFKWIEPLKTGELSTDNVVWLYIASDYSPLNSYIIDIADIKGVHYRLKNQQWNEIGKKFGFNGMPTYFIVDKEGNIQKIDNKQRSASEFKKLITDALKRY